LGLSLSWVCLMNCWAPGNPNLLGLGQPHLGWVYQKGVVVTDRPSAMMTGAKVHQQIDGLVANLEGGFMGYGEQHMCTHKSCLTWFPYYDDMLLPHNIDVMHTEKNVVQALWATIMDISGKSKDNIKARVDLVVLCDIPN
jgi:hypothetical protein